MERVVKGQFHDETQNNILSEIQLKRQPGTCENPRLADTVKVSVIVPVYNSENYLRQCLDSICAQTLREIEIICVDDGSTDGSYAILEEYCENDSRFSIYQQPNRTAGAARNLGKAHARGEYMVFWDSDDYFEPHAVETMYEKAAACQADICVCGASKYHQEWDKTVPHLQHYMNKKKVPDQEYFNIDSNRDNILLFTTAAPWNKMYRRVFILENQLDFQEVRNGNDIYFVICSLCLADRIVTIEEALITYRVHLEENLTGSTSKAPLTAIQAWEAAFATLQERDRFPEKSFANRSLKGIIYALHNIREYEPFREAVVYLQDGALDRLNLVPREEGFYDTEWYNDFLRSLREESPEQVLARFTYITYRQHMEISMRRQLANRDLAKKRTEIKGKKEQLEKTKQQVQNQKKQKEELQKQTDELKKQKEKLQEQLEAMEKQYTQERQQIEKQHMEEQKSDQKKMDKLQKQLDAERKKTDKLKTD